MFINEAKYINKILSSLIRDDIEPVLEIGSSSEEFRTKEKPHINLNIHAYLKNREINIITSDLKSDLGIDYSGNIFNKDFANTLKGLNPKLLLCCNIMEHIENPEEFAKIALDLIDEGSYIICSVPFSYPYHPDPIDTLFRPTPSEIHSLFKGTIIIEAKIIAGETFFQRLIYQGLFRGLFTLSRETLKFLFYIITFKFRLAINSRIFWMSKPFLTSLVLLKKCN